jgi:hypothetical protein
MLNLDHNGDSNSTSSSITNVRGIRVKVSGSFNVVVFFKKNHAADNGIPLYI